MEISNEIKAKVFGQYLGHKIRFDYAGPNQWNKLTPMHLTLDSPYKLLLKPLSAISDEDAEECKSILGYDELAGVYGIKKMIANLFTKGFKSDNIPGVSTILLIQFLQSKGYDMPSWYLNGKTLKECDLCTYE